MRLFPFIAAIICLLPLRGVVAQDALGAGNNKQGWFWYVDPELEELPPPDMTPLESEGLSGKAGYSTSWIRENLSKLRDEAIDDPTPTKVRAYLYVQRLAMDRASAFQESVAFVTSADPYLDQVSRFPTSEGGAAVGGRRAANAKEEVLFDLSRNAGIWFFYRSDCEYCHAMVPILLNMGRQYGFSIMPISLDGLPLDPRLPAYTTDRGQAHALNVEVTPSLFLVRPPNLDDVVPIAQGFVALPDIEERIIRMSYFHGWITEQQYRETRIANPMLLRSTDAANNTLNPNEIVHQLRPGSSSGGSTPVQPRPR